MCLDVNNSYKDNGMRLPVAGLSITVMCSS